MMSSIFHPKKELTVPLFEFSTQFWMLRDRQGWELRSQRDVCYWGTDPSAKERLILAHSRFLFRFFNCAIVSRLCRGMAAFARDSG